MSDIQVAGPKPGKKGSAPKSTSRIDVFGATADQLSPTELRNAITGYELRYRIEAVVAGITDKKLRHIYRGDGAATGREVMILPAIPQTKLFATEHANIILGYTMHEACHQLHTDFAILEQIFGGNQKPTKRDYQLKSFWNAIEDYRIEKLGRVRYPGFHKFISATRHHSAKRFVERFDAGEIPPQVVTNPYAIGAVALTWVGAKLNKYPTPMSEEALRRLPDDLREWTESWAPEMALVNTNLEAFDLANKILDDLDQQRQQQDDDSMTGDPSDSDQKQDQQDQQDQNSQSGQGSQGQSQDDQQDQSDQSDQSDDQDGSDDSSQSSDKGKPSKSKSKPEDGEDGDSQDGTEKDKDSSQDGKGSDSSQSGDEADDQQSGGSDGEEDADASEADDQANGGSNADGEDTDAGPADDQQDSGDGSSGDAQDDVSDNADGDEDGSDANSDGDDQADDASDNSQKGKSGNDQDDSSKQDSSQGKDQSAGDPDGDDAPSQNDDDASDPAKGAGSSRPQVKVQDGDEDADAQEADLEIDEISDELTNKASDVDNIMPDITEDVGRSETTEVERGQKRYTQIRGQIGPAASRAAGIMRRLLMARDVTRVRRELDEGALDLSRLVPIANGSQNIYKRVAHRSDVNTAVSILVDNSGSMSGQPITVCQQAAIVLDMAVQGTKADLEINGFTGGVYQPWIYRYRTFGQKGQASSASLGNMDKVQLGGTPVSQAMLDSWRRLHEHKAPRKIMIIITDGDADDLARSKEVHDLIVAMGGICVGIGIGNVASLGRWCKNTVQVNQVEDLPIALSQIVQQAMSPIRRAA